MPTYQYACTACGHELEAVQSFSDDALTTCPECSGALRKLFGNVGVVFKGSGFYRNDSRGKTTSSEASGSTAKPAAKTDSASSGSSGSDSSSSTSSSATTTSSSSAPTT